MLAGQQLRGAAWSVSGRRQCVELGIAEYKAMKKTVSFKTCVEESLKAKAHRRKRTLAEIRSVTARMMKECAGLGDRMVRSIKPDDCRKIIEIFPTASGKRKARTLLHGIFSFAMKRGWLDKNPIVQLDTPIVIERKIPVLNLDECKRLISTAQQKFNGSCLPAAALMLYAGIRPQEVRRLQFKHIRLDEHCILIPATHSKTGGARRVSLQPVLEKHLSTYANCEADAPICPAGWERKWKEIRTTAGWNEHHPWPQDVLRHSFASYHALQFCDYAALQWEMGHATPTLLRTRYLNMDSISKDEAKKFWMTA